VTDSIRVDSVPGAGSCFEFHLPYVASVAVAAPAPAATQPLAGISILVAEDDVINQMVLEENLRDDGARVVLVRNGQEAIEQVIHDGPNAYDIVLMDVQMPVMDGYEATRRILDLAPSLAVIGQTAHALNEEKALCFAAGMVGHVAKPIDPDLLVATILEHVGRKRSG
jgi:CheY-like chemotaxis protein